MKFFLSASCTLFLLAIDILLSLQTFAQKQGKERVDSLLFVLPSLHDDSDKVKLLNDLSFCYFTIHPNEGLTRGEQSRALAVKLNFKEGEARAYNSIGANYWAKNNYPLAQENYLKSLKINDSLHDKKEIARNIHNIADIYQMEYNYPKSLEYYQKALAIVEEIKFNDAIIGFQANIAEVYQKQKKYTQALFYLQKSLKLSEDLKITRNIGFFYGEIGLIEYLQGDHFKALADEKIALKIVNALGERNPIRDDKATILKNIAIIYLQKGQYNYSLFYFRYSLRLFNLLPGSEAKKNCGQCLAGIGKIYLKIATLTDSGFFSGYSSDVKRLQYLKKAEDTLKIANKLSQSVGDWMSLTEFLPALSKTQQLLGSYQEALYTYIQYTNYKDSLYNNEKDKEIISHQMEYEYGKQKDSLKNVNTLQLASLHSLLQEKELSRLRVKQQTLNIIFGFITLCLIAFYFFYRDYLMKIKLHNELLNERIEKKLRQAEHEKNMSHTTLIALVSQMNPHFLFNALNTIQSFIYSNDKKNASNYLGKFSELTRKILDNSSKKFISLDEEIILLQLYLDIEKVRFGDSFIASIEVDIKLDKEEIFLPPMLVQPHVENAIKHGLLHKPGEKKLLISILSINDKNEVEIIIDDNGIGREKSMEINSKKVDHHSFANIANERRIDLINKSLDKKIILRIIDKKNRDGSASGTTIIFTIPNMGTY